jgi:hypothetical protein
VSVYYCAERPLTVARFLEISARVREQMYESAYRTGVNITIALPHASLMDLRESAARSESALYGSIFGSWMTSGDYEFTFAGVRLLGVHERPEGAVDVPGSKVERVEPRGWKCEACGGSGQSSNRAAAFMAFGSSRCPACDGLGCSVMAEWARRERWTVRPARHGDAFEWHVSGGPWRMRASPAIVLFWAVADEIAGLLMLDHGEGVPYSQLVADIASMPRPLCTLPEQWDRQIDIRLDPFAVPIDEVVDGKAVRRSGTPIEAARVRATAARERYFDGGRRDIPEAVKQWDSDLAIIRSSIAGIDPFEPDWHTQWWLALREWTTAGQEPDPDAMADILRGLGYERRKHDNPWVRVVHTANGPVLERIADWGGPVNATVSLGDADDDDPSVTLQFEQVEQARRHSATEFLRQYNGDWLPPEPTR